MKNFIENVRKLSDVLKNRHGEMSLFAIMLPEQSTGQWDLVLAAPWLSGNLSDYDMVAAEMKRLFSPAEMAAISRIVVLGKGPLNFQGMKAPSRLGEMRDFTFNDEPIKEAYIFNSRTARLASLPKPRSTKLRGANGQG